MQPNKTQKDKLKAQPGCYELFLLTVPIEEVARWQYMKQFR